MTIERDTSWDFKSANTKLLTHCFHSYPAMMIPQIAARIIDLYGRKNQLLFDPYCGTGTSLVEASLKGITGIGTDINPLARLITKTKLTSLSLQVLDLYLKDFNDFIFLFKFNLHKEKIILPDFANIDFWFTSQVKFHLAVIKHFIDKIENENVANFYKVAFSETIRETSLSKNSEFKLVRMKPAQIKKFVPDVFSIMERKLSRNRNGLKDYMEFLKSDKKSQVCSFDTIEAIPKEVIETESIDLVVTSPPYGDSKTTVAYGQFSRLSNQWLGVADANQVDNKLMGGKRAIVSQIFDCQALDEQIAKIGEQDEKRALEVIGFYKAYEKSISNVASTIRFNGYAAYVVGNRRVKGEELPTDVATVNFFERRGFTHLKTIVRGIPNKKMPKENSPTNEVGKKHSTMNFEYIVLMQKNAV